jgi:tetraacyldisaccharide 4'-kinase
VPVLRADHSPLGLRDETGSAQDLALLAGREVDLASGVGNPEAFERTVRGLGASVREHRAFPDHHAFAAADLAGLGEGGRPLVVTAKDAVKLASFGTRFLVLDVELAIVSGETVLDALLGALAPGAAADGRTALRAGMHG